MKRFIIAFGCFLLVARIEGCSEPRVPYAYIRTTAKPYGGRYGPGANLYFECHDGYMMEGRSTIKCSYSYRWDYDPPKCYKKKEYCAHPKTFFGGEFYPDKPKYSYMDKVYYACPGKHYKYIYSSCEKDGGWKQAKMCYDYCDVPDLKYGYYEPKMKKYRYGDTIKYYCDDGYYKYYAGKEYKMAKCGEDGMWDMKKPMCKKYCRAPTDYKMYHHMPYSKTTYKMGEKIMYHCMKGYSAPSYQKYRYSTCIDGGIWDGKPYKCETSCMAPDHTEYYHQPYDKKVYKPRERITYRCMEGYYHKSGYEYGTASCMTDGSWNYKPDYCTKYCMAPKIFKHGYYKPPEKKYYKYGEKMYYYCDEGYKMYYKEDKYEYNICDRKGKWRYMEPMCKKYCMPPMKKHLYYMPKMDKYNVGDKLKYKCEDGYRMVFGKDWYEKNTCDEHGQWMFEPPMCKKIYEDVCEPPMIKHGWYGPILDSYKYMDQIVYKCDDGYQMYKEEEWMEEYSTCMKGGKWKYMAPMCKPKKTHYCKPPMIMNGSYRPPKKMYMVDDRVYHYCHEGYKLYYDKDWFEYATCLKDGNFDYKPPKCIDTRKTYCDPPEFMHGKYMPKMHKYEKDDRLYYECEKGYQIYYGDDWFEYSSCMSDGTWDFDPPMCRRVYSDERQFCYPPELMHGKLRPGKSMYEVGEKLYYECEEDYMKYYHGDRYEYSMCQSDGTWDKKAPMCKSKYKDYCKPPRVMHGSYKPKMKMYNPGDRIRYDCDYGYDMYYKEHSYYYATCMQDGMWDNKPVMCKHSQTMYCKKPMLEHGYYKPMRKMYDPGDRMYFWCKPGYGLDYGEKKYESMMCGKDGKWDHKMPTCKMMKKEYCDPPVIEHGYYMEMKEKYMVGDKVSYKCKEGYMLFYGDDWFVYSTCKPGGYWDFKPPMCKEKKMKYCHPPDYHYGSYMPRMRMYNEGAHMYYKCDRGYKMHYKDNKMYDYNTCKDGKWKYESPKCVEMKKKYCKPPMIKHGMYKPMMDMYMKGDRVWYKCVKGYMMEDDYDMEYSTCKEDGMWDMKPPMCKKKSMSYCMHSKMKYGYYKPKKPYYSRGERVSYYCDYGYEMKYHIGKPYQYSTCKSDGNWDYDMPKCMDKSKKYCMAPDVMHSMYMPMKKYYGYGDRVYFKCKYGYYLYYGGYYHRHSTCTTMGKWDVLPKCKEMQKKYCKSPDYKDYHHKPYAKKYYMAGEWMKYECSSSYYPESKSMKKYAMCKDDGTWDYAPRKCIKYCMVDDMKYRYYKPMKKYYMPGEQITYYCKNGYYVSDRSYMKAICMKGGKWDQIGPMCKKPCYAPYYIPNGQMYGSKYSYGHGEKMTFSCNRGYGLSSEKNYIECGYYGKWRSALPSCRRN